MFCRSVQVTVGKHNKCHHRMHRLIIVPYKSIPSAQNQPATSHPVVPVKTKSPLESSHSNSNGLNWNIVPRVIICRLNIFFLCVTNVLLNKGSNTGLNDLENRKCHFTKSCLVILLKVQIHETILAWPLSLATTISSGQERLGFKSSIILYTDWTRTVRTVHMRMVANNFTQRDHNHIISEIHEI